MENFLIKSLFYFQIEMHNGLAVHIIDSLAYLPDELNAIAFSQCKVVGYDSLEQLAARDAVCEKLDISKYFNGTFPTTNIR